ncbi:hypothetical protein JAAARDRAFT_195758 [Jaapia argillacea MUCL 33604]|uniref:DUF6697 domain-containing protein n=1 Tax=Jaapia argillacea MUCL 33604 TaxID=933084 RepID=A0A067PKC7_9AGAM|nr:hypothetical protein JAAARDRAFT_195758 [Jaapia argillacea MUCL 33604]
MATDVPDEPAPVLLGSQEASGFDTEEPEALPRSKAATSQDITPTSTVALEINTISSGSALDALILPSSAKVGQNHRTSISSLRLTPPALLGSPQLARSGHKDIVKKRHHQPSEPPEPSSDDDPEAKQWRVEYDLFSRKLNKRRRIEKMQRQKSNSTHQEVEPQRRVVRGGSNYLRYGLIGHDFYHFYPHVLQQVLRVASIEVSNFLPAYPYSTLGTPLEHLPLPWCLLWPDRAFQSLLPSMPMMPGSFPSTSLNLVDSDTPLALMTNHDIDMFGKRGPLGRIYDGHYNIEFDRFVSQEEFQNYKRNWQDALANEVLRSTSQLHINMRSRIAKNYHLKFVGLWDIMKAFTEGRERVALLKLKPVKFIDQLRYDLICKIWQLGLTAPP